MMMVKVRGKWMLMVRRGDILSVDYGFNLLALDPKNRACRRFKISPGD